MHGGWVGSTMTAFLARYAERIVSYLKYVMTNFKRIDFHIHVLDINQVPASSGSNGIKMSNILEASGKSVIGWDVEWPVNWNTNRLKTGGTAMYGTMNSRHTKVNVSAITIRKTINKYYFINLNQFIYYSHREKLYYLCTTWHIGMGAT